jgi:hypothetical protein
MLPLRTSKTATDYSTNTGSLPSLTEGRPLSTVYLIVAESTCASEISASLAGTEVEAVHSCAWVLPWQGNAHDLLGLLHTSVPQAHLLVSQVSEEWACV